MTRVGCGLVVIAVCVGMLSVAAHGQSVANAGTDSSGGSSSTQAATVPEDSTARAAQPATKTHTARRSVHKRSRKSTVRTASARKPAHSRPARRSRKTHAAQPAHTAEASGSGEPPRAEASHATEHRVAEVHHAAEVHPAEAVHESQPVRIPETAHESPSVRGTQAVVLASVHRPIVRRLSRPGLLPTYGDPSVGDDPSRDDPAVRAAAVEALGKLMGSVVAVDPHNGRVLAVVDQQLAFSGGYQPCSSFKPAVALAALHEGIIQDDSSRLKLGSRFYLNLQKALEISNNQYFEALGRKLGLEKMQEYAEQFGFGEPAGWDIQPEPDGAFPTVPPPAKDGGVGKVASFGEGISMTMFELVSFVSAIDNGGTLYYLQYPPHNAPFEPRIKRQLTLNPGLDAVRQGMELAVLGGTARRAQQPDVQVLGKTGSCSQDGAHLGWFGGFIQEPGGIAVAVLLRTGLNLGGGPRASEVAGRMFRRLDEDNYFQTRARKPVPESLPASLELPLLPALP